MRAPLRLVPGILLATLVGLAALGIARLETRAFGQPVVEGLVVAILLGMLVRAAWEPPAATDAGVAFTAKQVLEIAVLLLGASVDLPLLLTHGWGLAAGIVAIVILGIGASFAIGRIIGLPRKLAILVACGTGICGNSAIAAVAPVIRADHEHVASSIAFTALLGVLVVIALPLLVTPLHLNFYQYGVLAGLTVYAVPQVLAAAFPVSALSGQVGTLVKLVRVLMLGPVVLFFALTHRRETAAPAGSMTAMTASRRTSVTTFVPWFIIGFLLLAILRSTDVLPDRWVAVARAISTWLTVAAMAALGLGVDVRAVRKVGAPVIATVTISLLVLIALAVALIRGLQIR